MAAIFQNDKTSTCLVIGGTGFIGRHLLDELSKQNSCTIKALTRHQDKHATFPNNVQPVIGDLTEFESIVNFSFPGSTVVNLAYLNTGTTKDNIYSIQNLTTACTEVGIRRLIHCSTALVVGRTSDKPITEDTVCKPATEYERIKFAIESFLLQSLKEHCEVVILRPTVVFGVNGKNLVKLADGLVKGNRLTKQAKASLLFNVYMIHLQVPTKNQPKNDHYIALPLLCHNYQLIALNNLVNL